MKTLALSALAVLLILGSTSVSLGEEAQPVGGHPIAVVERLRADEPAHCLRVLVGQQRPGGDCLGIVTLGDGERARGLPWGRGTDYKLRVIEPPRGVDCKIVCIRPNPNVDCKIRILGPGGHDVWGAPLANRRKTILIDPNRRGRRK